MSPSGGGEINVTFFTQGLGGGEENQQEYINREETKN